MQKYTTQLVLVEDSRGTGGMHSTCYEGVGGWGERGLHAQRVTFESAGLGMSWLSHHGRSAKLPSLGPRAVDRKMSPRMSASPPRVVDKITSPTIS